jgi:hypothetical protein
MIGKIFRPVFSAKPPSTDSVELEQQIATERISGLQQDMDGRMKPSTNAKITLFCPSGHRLRGGTELMGRRVKCPKCKTEFVFAPTASESRPAGSNRSDATSKRTVSESGVMAILGEMDRSVPPPRRQPPPSRPCPKCRGSVLESLSVCPSCNMYLGVMPTFMRELHDPSDQ